MIVLKLWRTNKYIWDISLRPVDKIEVLFSKLRELWCNETQGLAPDLGTAIPMHELIP